jgi:hypothetical protein
MQIPSISFADWQKDFRVLSLAEFIALDPSRNSSANEDYESREVEFRVYAGNAWIVKYIDEEQESYELRLEGCHIISGPLDLLEMCLYIYGGEEGSI